MVDLETGGDDCPAIPRDDRDAESARLTIRAHHGPKGRTTPSGAWERSMERFSEFIHADDWTGSSSEGGCRRSN